MTELPSAAGNGGGDGRVREKGGEKMARARRILIRRCGEWGGVVAWVPSDWDRAVGREGVRASGWSGLAGQGGLRRERIGLG